METINLAEMDPSLPPSSNSSKSMEEMYQSVRIASSPITWEGVLFWAQVADVFNSLEAQPLTEEEAKALWSEYANSETLGRNGGLQPHEFEASFGLSPLEDLPYPEEP